MKWYHFGLFFSLIFLTFVLTEQIRFRNRSTKEKYWESEHNYLVEAVDAMLSELSFDGIGSASENSKKEGLRAFLDTLSVLHMGNPDAAGREEIKKRVPCILLLEEDCFYWCAPYENDGMFGPIAYTNRSEKEKELHYVGEEATAQIEHCLQNFLKQYGIQTAVSFPRLSEGVFERGLSSETVLAVYYPFYAEKQEKASFVYAASKRVTEYYPVTSDGRYHRGDCVHMDKQQITEVFFSAQSAAKSGAYPCDFCLEF